MNTFLQKLGKIILKMLLAILMLLIFLWVLLQTSFFQNVLIDNVTKRLSKNLNTTVSVERVDFRLFDKLLLRGTLVLDHHQDTLLYAGALKVNMTDWFFFKDHITLNYIGLENATVFLHRTDSVWNYQFLQDYFSSPPKARRDTTPEMLSLDLKEMDLQDVKIFQQDQWVGTDMLVSLEKLNLKVNRMNLQERKVEIEGISLTKPFFSQYEYTGRRPPSAKKTPPPPLPGVAQWNPAGWKITVEKISLAEGTVAIDRESDAPVVENRFDEDHILLSQINGTVSNMQLRQDSLTADVLVALTSRGEFDIDRLQTHYKLTPVSMEFHDLEIVTPKSRIGNYFAMHYRSFNQDMNQFIEAVTMEGNFEDSQIHSDELAFFAPAVKDWNTLFHIDGTLWGKVENLKATNVKINANGSNYLSGDIQMRGLPHIDETFIDLRIDHLRTRYGELATLIPALANMRHPNLSAFDHILYTGNFTGFVRNFVTFGQLSTSIGTLDLDLQLKLPENGLPAYRGKISTQNFDLGTFVNSPQLGSIAFDGKIDGSGFRENRMSLDIDGSIQKLEFNGYPYSNIRAQGHIRNNLFSGTASVQDENIRVDSLNGSINFSKSSPGFFLTANVGKLDFRKLGFIDEPVTFSGWVDLNFEGNHIDNFLGQAKLYDATLSNGQQKLPFDSLVVYSTMDDSSKMLTVRSNELEASIEGKFKVAYLANAFQGFLSQYYPSYIEKPPTNKFLQSFQFSIKTRYIADYLRIFDKNLGGLNQASVTGVVDMAQTNFLVSASVPEFRYSTLRFKDLEFQGIGTSDSLLFSAFIDDIVINDSLHSPGTQVAIVSANDVSKIQIQSSANKTISAADISATILTQKNGFTLTFDPSKFTINRKDWEIAENGEIILNGNLLMAHNIKMTQNGQEIYLSTIPSDIGNSTDVIIALQNVVIEDFTPLFLRNPDVQGLLNANLQIVDPFGKMEIELDSRIDQFAFEGDSIGTIAVTGDYVEQTGNAKLHILSNNQLYNFVGDIDYVPADSLNPLEGKITFNNSGFHILEPYLEGIFSELDGRAKGTLYLTGQPSAPKLTGSLLLNETNLTVDYTQVKYTLAENTKINFNPDEIDLGSITLKDSLGNEATLTGKIYHNFFDEFFFNEIHIQTKSPRFLLLNTSAADNDEFYGTVWGTAELSLNGPVTDMRMNISGGPTDSSHIYLPLGETVESGNINYIDFIQFGREMKPDTRIRENTNIRVNMELNANPLAKIDVILDETTGDIIHAQGSGKLFISVGTKDPLTIRGRYNIEEGEYTFNFQTFLKTPFILEGGYIEWQGDPYLANLHIDAIYTAQNVILNNIPTSTGLSNTRGDVNILFRLRGTLREPTPTFEFQFPFDNPLKSDPIANEYLKTRYQSDNNQLLNQVASLLLFNMFMNNEQGFLNSYNTTNFVAKSVGQLLSTTLSNSLNTWLQRLLNTKDINFYTNINTSDFNFQREGIQREIQNVGNFGFQYNINNNLLLNVGGNVDYRLRPSVNNNGNLLLTPDLSFEYLITPEGRLRVIGFNRSDADPGDLAGITRRNRTGIQLSYRRDFDTFEEFFTNKRSKR